MALYEHIFIARQDISAQAVDTLAEEMAGIITENGGHVKKTENWGLRTLAYRIKKNRKGHYVLMNLDAPSSAIQEMERLERLNEDILRIMTIRVEEHEEEPSALLRGGDDRDDRRGGRDRGERGERGDRDDRPRREDRPDRVATATPVASNNDSDKGDA
jgi:small subunit ribosomal protein S6